MPAVFVHGVPETARVWDPLTAQLSRSDTVALSLPGFEAPRPDGFGATKEEYVDWLVGELEDLRSAGPVDLVGHDWGGGFVVRLVSLRPDLVRSWVTDAAGVGGVDFEWHEMAKLWQTPEAGEAFFAQNLAMSPEQRARVFESFGIPPEHAIEMGGWPNEEMADTILRLYRSAIDVGSEWGPDFSDVATPGLVLVPSDDAFLGADGARRAAARAGAEVAELDGLGHWWMLQDPRRGAGVLEGFWSSLGGTSAPQPD
ncbi:MAG: alpha/beta hydrolase [Actinobacteria bacterium]|nr:alpha/beta hydrolase [Actinomycetota bacterium]